MGMILRIASSRIVGQGDIVGRSGYFSLNLSANSVMRGRLDARRTLKSLVADLRLYKKIKALTNLSVVEFIRSIRLNYAMEKLRSGEYNVTEVSEMCGFNTSAYFSKVFKEYFGKTPTEVMQNSAL